MKVFMFVLTLAGAAAGCASGSDQTLPRDRVTVTVTVGAHGAAGKPLISVKIVNRRKRSIYTEDMKTACSIVSLERRSRGHWRRIGACQAERAPIVVEIGSGRSRTVKIDARDTGATHGRYRAVLTYRLAARPEGEEPERAESAPFDLV